MEKEYQISWFKIIGIVALITVAVIIIYLVYPNKNNNDSYLTQQTYINNITLMKNAGFEYFKGSKLPLEVGDTSRLTLDEMLARNLIVEFSDENGNACDVKNSYIEATKTMDNEYEMSVYLSCDNKSDYIITSISNEVVCTDCEINKDDENVMSNVTDNSNGNKVISPTFNNNSQSLSSTSSSGNDRPVNITQTTNVNVNVINSNNNCDDDCLARIYYSVAFDSNGGSYVRTQIVKSGGYAQYVESYRYGYEFLGWYLNGEKFDFNTPITKKITLVAKWKKIDIAKEKYIVKFDSNGGSDVASQTVEEGNKAYEPKNPLRSGYEFLGWYLNGKLYDFNTLVYEDITLVAKWKKMPEQYNKYCKIEDKTYYSVSYIGTYRELPFVGNWVAKFSDLTNVKNVKVTDYGYLNTLAMYNQAYYEKTYKMNLNTVNGDSSKYVPINSGYDLRNYSLKANNFTPVVGVPYYKNGDWYINLGSIINNDDNAKYYYAANINSNIYFVPFYFDLEYTNLENCIIDKASNSAKYEDYEIISSYWE